MQGAVNSGVAKKRRCNCERCILEWIVGAIPIMVCGRVSSPNSMDEKDIFVAAPPSEDGLKHLGSTISPDEHL